MLRIRFYPWRRENIYFFTEKNFDADIVRKLLKQDKIVELKAIVVPKELTKRIHRGFTAEMTKYDERTDITLSCIRGMVAKKDMIKVFFVQPIWNKDNTKSRYLQDIPHNEEVIENYKMFVEWLSLVKKEEIKEQ